MENREKVVIPKGVAPNVKKVIQPIIDEINSGGLLVDFSGSDESIYGHAMRNLAHKSFGSEGRSEQEQMMLLKDRAQRLVNKYGPQIKDRLSPELVKALDLEIID